MRARGALDPGEILQMLSQPLVVVLRKWDRADERRELSLGDDLDLSAGLDPLELARELWRVARPEHAIGPPRKLAVVWQAVDGNTSTVWFNTSSDFGATWATPKQIVTAGTSLYPWVAYRSGKIAVSLYHSDANATPDTAPAGAQWFESYLESTDGGATFSALQSVDPTPVKTGPVCTGGINCSANRELGDFQQVAIDNAGKSVMSYVHSIDNAADTEIRFVKQA